MKKQQKIPLEGIVDDIADQMERGYWLGSLFILDVPFHVELIELKDYSDGDTGIFAKNKEFQGRIDSWIDKNDGEFPKLLNRGRKTFFVHVEVYAE